MGAQDHLQPAQFTRSQLSSRWQRGQCGIYADELTRMRPGLKLGMIGARTDPEDPEFVEDHHYFAHDEMHAYDSLGRHPLPYAPAWASAQRLTEAHLGGPLHEEHDYYGVIGGIDTELDAGEDEEETRHRARQHIQRHRILGE